MTDKEKDKIVSIAKEILDELKLLGESVVNNSFEDYLKHELQIKNLLVLLEFI